MYKSTRKERKVPCSKCGETCIRSTLRKAVCSDCIKKRQLEYIIKNYPKIYGREYKGPLKTKTVKCDFCPNMVERKITSGGVRCYDCRMKRERKKAVKWYYMNKKRQIELGKQRLKEFSTHLLAI